MIDIEHHAVRALEQDAFAGRRSLRRVSTDVSQRYAHQARRRTLRICVDDLGGLDRLRLEHRLQVGDFCRERCARSFSLKNLKFDEILEAQAGARHLVFVGRTDAESGGADRTLAQARLARAIDRAMIRHHHVCVVTELQQGVVAEMAAAV